MRGWKSSKDTDWEGHIDYVLLAYNHKMANRTNGMAPCEARKERGHLGAHQGLRPRAKHDRVYPDSVVGDRVKIYTKKKRLDTERKSVWSLDSYTVEGVEVSHGQQFYKTSASAKPFIRHETLKVKQRLFPLQ